MCRIESFDELDTSSVQQLVVRFVDIGLAQDRALLQDESAQFNRLFDRMQKVVRELKERQGDQRRVLIALDNHPNIQVRLKAALTMGS
jgi:hypothetical protein